jgi:hypothetical protein
MVDEPVHDPLVAGPELCDASDLRPVLVRAREELQGLLDGLAVSLLELGARGRVEAGELRKRRAELRAP